MTQVLSSDEAKKILHAEARPVNAWKPRWPSIEDAILIFRALENKATQVELSHGKFNIKYSEGYSYKLEENRKHSTAYVYPIEGFAPCGWFDQDGLRKELLEGRLGEKR